MNRKLNPWNEFDPQLYNLQVKANFGKYATETKEITFGLRDLKAENGRLILNGKKIFLRGEHDGGLFPLTGYPSMDKSEWLKIFSKGKTYGLNHWRFHSWCPPEAAFEAADELGIILQAELPLFSQTWENSVVGKYPRIDTFLKSELVRILDAYGNHPSFGLMCMGNELKGDPKVMQELVAFAKTNDSRHLYAGTANLEAIGIYERLIGDDYQVAHAGKYKGTRFERRMYPYFNLEIPNTIKDYSYTLEPPYNGWPIISHEVGQWTVFPDFSEIGKYTGVLSPRNLEVFKSRLQQKGMLDQAHDFLMASGKLSALLYREEIERLLRTPGMSGFQLLDLRDYPGQGSALVGLLNPFWESKGLITSEVFRQSCNDITVLLKMPKRVWTNNENFTANLVVPNYSLATIPYLQVKWKVLANNQLLFEGEIDSRELKQGEVNALGDIAFDLSKVDRATKLNIILKESRLAITNSYEVWVYPSQINTEVPTSLTLATKADDELYQKLQDGAAVLLVSNDLPDTERMNFTTPFWSTILFDYQAKTMGILCNPEHPIFRNFPTDFHSNWQWWELTKDARILRLNKTNSNYRPILQVIDHPVRNDKLGAIMEMKVGKGKLLICTLDIMNKLDDRPVVRQLKKSILEYMESADFNPEPNKELTELIFNIPVPGTVKPLVLKAESFLHYAEDFNRNDNELYKGFYPNSAAWNFLKDNIPLFDCPDEEIQRTYYFRWWTYRKHIKQTPDGFIVDEFLPNVGWAGKHNSISCAAGHHFYEGRWLHVPQYLDDYSTFWFRKGGEPRRYSFWAADALWARYRVSGNKALVIDLLPDLVKNYEAWEKSNLDPTGLFWQIDDRDGGEMSIGGNGYRATINSYQYGDAVAIAQIAGLAGKPDVACEYRDKAAKIKQLVQEKLWDKAAQFFKVLPQGENRKLVDVREEHGYTPWYFNLPDADKAIAWKQAMDPKGFYAPFGPTTAEQRHPKFALSYQGHECQWNGPSWPYATAVTLTGLANLLNGPSQDAVSATDYFDLLTIYTKSHRLKFDDGRVVSWIDENLNPLTGDWLSRMRLKTWKNGTWDTGKGGEERGKDYNHSTYCDLIITGLIGLRPRADETVEVNPLVPEGTWDYFCLDQIRYHGHWLTILFDKSGERYGKGRGLRVFSDGKEIAVADKLTRVTGKLSAASEAAGPETAGGWKKFPGNPVMGGKYGTCFDISVLHDGGKYRMWLSWRPKKSVALVESKDGIHWSEPPQVVLGPRKETGWEDDINRPFVLKRADGYHMWYTGQAKGRSWIGYATSSDGVKWKRMSDKPVLSFDQPWELNIAVMCPSVIWDETAKQFRMWYSGGEQNEPNAIGYATSPDGLTWEKHEGNPVFTAERKNPWEKHKVTACQVEKVGDWYVMFYIGFQDEPTARICLARSKDGITNWQRHPANPIIFPGKDKLDHDACYKPFAIFDGTKWLLWYNGRHGGLEQIGVVLHEGEDLGFDQ